MRARTSIAVLAAALGGLRSLPAQASVVEAVEFYNTDLKHYFVTASPSEIGSIETGGAGPGWVRTGGSFRVYSSANDAPGLQPVCRFYGTPGRGPNSHFYTADPGECDFVKTQDPGWTYEGIAFHIALPSGGRCASGETPVYRTFNNGGTGNDANHRFTVDATVFEVDFFDFRFAVEDRPEVKADIDFIQVDDRLCSGGLGFKNPDVFQVNGYVREIME